MSLRPYSDGTEHHASVEIRGGRRRLRAAFRVPAGSGLRAAWLRCHPDGEAEFRAMHRTADGPWERWEGVVTLRGPRLPYRFVLQDADGRLHHFNQRGLSAAPPLDDADFVHLDHPPPSWLAGTTFYQIMPDRFARGTGQVPAAQRAAAAGLPLPRARAELAWGQRPPGYRSGGDRAFMGGDLAGLRARVAYLSDLGVGALSLTPIFLAGTYHRYDTWDYHQIDPRLGSNQDLAALTRELHLAGMRIVLDGVFNHVGDGHRWFNRRCVFAEPGAWQDGDSPFVGFFYFTRHPERYESWLGHRELVKLDYRSERLRAEIYAGHQSVVRRWLRPPYNIDGWRLDVGNMLGRCGAVQLNGEVLREVRRAVKETSPDAVLLGENFQDPTAQLQGDQLDAVQAYQGFHFPVLRWLTGRESQIPTGLRPPPPALDADTGGAGHLAASLLEARARLPFAIAQAQMLQLGSHDTPRILTALGGDEDLARLATVLLLTWPGTPCIYYGDEVGLEGGRDPENRRGMEWDEAAWNRGLLDRYRRLVALRRRDEVLARGGVQVLHAVGDVFAFARILGADARVVVLNRADARRTITLDLSPLGWFEGAIADLLTDIAFAPTGGRLTVILPPRTARILQPEATA